MPTLRRRIEALEKLAPSAPDLFEVARARALAQLTEEQLNLLTIVVSAREQQRHGPFTEAETAAVQALHTALEREIRSLGFRTLHQFMRCYHKRKLAGI